MITAEANSPLKIHGNAEVKKVLSAFYYNAHRSGLGFVYGMGGVSEEGVRETRFEQVHGEEW